MGAESLLLVKELIESGWNQGDFVAAKKVLVDDKTTLAEDESFTYQGREAIEKLINEFRATYPEKKLVIRDQVAEGDVVVTHVASLPVKDKKGASFPSNFTLYHRILDDKIAAIEITPKPSDLAKPGALLTYTCLAISRMKPIRHAILITLLVAGAWILINELADHAEVLIDSWLVEDSNLLTQDLRLEQPLALNRHMSSDGKRVVFVTDLALAPEVDTNGMLDVYVIDLDTKQYILASRGIVSDTTDTRAVAGTSWSIDPLLSADGKKVLFLSYADNLVAETNLPKPSNFEYNIETDTTRVVRKAADTTINLPVDALWWVSGSRFERARILQQYETARMMAIKHQRLLKYFFRYRFAYLLVTFLVTLISVLALVIIIRVGWSNADPYAITIFMTASALVIWFTTVPNIYSLDENLDLNRRAYVQYANLASLIRSYVGTGVVTDSDTEAGQEMEPSAFILRVDKALAEAFSLPLKLNSAAVPSRDDLLGLFDLPIAASNAAGTSLTATTSPEPPLSVDAQGAATSTPQPTPTPSPVPTVATATRTATPAATATTQPTASPTP